MTSEFDTKQALRVLKRVVAGDTLELADQHATILRLTNELNRATEYIANQESPEAWDAFCNDWGTEL